MLQAANHPAGTADSLLTDFNLYLFNEVTHVRVYEKLGAHLTSVDGQPGVAFAVWAPNADDVSVIGEFNNWDPDTTRLHPRASSGIWQGFVPGVGQGAQYKYSIKPRFARNRIDKADPFGFAAEFRRQRVIRARRSAPGRTPGLGHQDLQLRPERGAEFPAVQCRVLGRAVSHRWLARGRGGLDAVPGLLARARAVGAEPIRRPRKP